MLVVREHRDRRAKHGRLGRVGGAVGVILCDLKHKPQAASERGRRDAEGFAFIAFVERADGDECVSCNRVCWRMAEKRVDENLKLVEVGFEDGHDAGSQLCSAAAWIASSAWRRNCSRASFAPSANSTSGCHAVSPVFVS